MLNADYSVEHGRELELHRGIILQLFLGYPITHFWSAEKMINREQRVWDPGCMLIIISSLKKFKTLFLKDVNNCLVAYGMFFFVPKI